MKDIPDPGDLVDVCTQDPGDVKDQDCKDRACCYLVPGAHKEICLRKVPFMPYCLSKVLQCVVVNL